MFKFYASPNIRKIHQYMKDLYGSRSEECMERISMLVGRYGMGYGFSSVPEQRWDQKTSVLITYGDMVVAKHEKPLQTLKRFLDKHLVGAIQTVHILPFFPYSSDDGFSVIDYRQVNPDLGDWQDIRSLSECFHLMFDLVLNHCSSQNAWFQDFQNGISPGREFFITLEPDTNLDSVVRPRTSPLLTKFHTPACERHVWTTFSDDQIDLNFSNPDVLFEFLDILMFYITQGARIIRLDAIAYLWKEIGSSCIHLPQTHTVVKLIREFTNMLAPETLILTETNVPHDENISYFGDGDEAHIVYQFSLPPLLLHALLFENSRYLTDWAASLEDAPQGCTFLNFTASHDGIGVRPLEGLIPEEEFTKVVKSVHHRGGLVSTKRNEDGTESPYELNITYFDALSDPGKKESALHIARFLCSQTIPLGLKGIPALYFHSLMATPNDHVGVDRTGMPRSINRKKWQEKELNKLLNDLDSATAQVFFELIRRLRLRSEHPAFHPDASQNVYDLGTDFFAFERTSTDQKETIVCISNVTQEDRSVDALQTIPLIQKNREWINLLQGEIRIAAEKQLTLAPYETVWLKPSPTVP